MRAPWMRNWLHQGMCDAPVEPIGAISNLESETEKTDAAVDSPRWSADRLRIVDSLWGNGFVFPGGEYEMLRLAKPIGLSSASSLLLLGAGSGGPVCSLAAKMGVWVTGLEADTELFHAAEARVARRNLGRRAQVLAWNKHKTELSGQSYHHAIALEPLCGCPIEPVLSAVEASIKTGGQFVMVELVADSPLDLSDASVRRWCELEHRDATRLPTEVSITRVLGRLGFDVRIVEDISQRHMNQALLGWRARVRAMQDAEPSALDARILIAEAELWLMRLRLLRSGRMRMVRWSAIGRHVSRGESLISGPPKVC